MLNPTHLQTLRMVVAEGSFARAARMLGYTPSAVSQQIAALEEEVGFPLFDRRARATVATPEALMLADESAEVLGMLEDLGSLVGDLAHGRRSHLVIGSFPSASEHLLPRALTALRRSGRIAVELHEDEPQRLLPSLVDRQLDLVLAYEYDLVPLRWPGGMLRDTLLSEELVLVVPASRTSLGERPRLADLADEVWMCTAVDSDGSVCLERACAAAGFVPNVAFRSNDYDVVHRLVGAGHGVALVPGMAVRPAPDIRVLRPEGLDLFRHVSVLRRGGAAKPALSAMDAALRDSAHALAAEADWLTGPSTSDADAWLRDSRV